MASTPILYLHGNAPTLERPSEHSERSAEVSADAKTSLNEHEGKVLGQLKRRVFGDEEVAKGKRRKKKGGPNPLSCKKKAKKQNQPLRQSDGDEGKGKRKRKRNKKASSFRSSHST